MDNGFLKDLAPYIATLGSLAISQFVEHPVGTMVSIVGLLYSYERWRNQRIMRKINLEELKRIEEKSKDHPSDLGSERIIKNKDT